MHRRSEVALKCRPRTVGYSAALPHAGIRPGAAFLAGKAFLAYRRRGGAKGAPLPDFYIGAHAAVTGLVLLTRDDTRYRTYFPTVRLIAP